MNALGKNLASVVLTFSLGLVGAACDTSGMGGLGESALGGGGYQPAGGGYQPSGGGGNLVGTWGVHHVDGTGLALKFTPGGEAGILKWAWVGNRFVFESGMGRYRVSGNQVEMMLDRFTCRTHTPGTLRLAFQVRGDSLDITLDNGERGTLERDVQADVEKGAPLGCIDRNGNFSN